MITHRYFRRTTLESVQPPVSTACVSPFKARLAESNPKENAQMCLWVSVPGIMTRHSCSSVLSSQATAGAPTDVSQPRGNGTDHAAESETSAARMLVSRNNPGFVIAVIEGHPLHPLGSGSGALTSRWSITDSVYTTTI